MEPPEREGSETSYGLRKGLEASTCERRPGAGPWTAGFMGMAAFNAHVDPNGINSIREGEAEAQKSQATRAQSYSQAEAGTDLKMTV